MTVGVERWMNETRTGSEEAAADAAAAAAPAGAEGGGGTAAGTAQQRHKTKVEVVRRRLIPSIELEPGLFPHRHPITCLQVWGLGLS